MVESLFSFGSCVIFHGPLDYLRTTQTQLSHANKAIPEDYAVLNSWPLACSNSFPTASFYPSTLNAVLAEHTEEVSFQGSNKLSKPVLKTKAGCDALIKVLALQQPMPLERVAAGLDSPACPEQNALTHAVQVWQPVQRGVPMLPCPPLPHTPIPNNWLQVMMRY